MEIVLALSNGKHKTEEIILPSDFLYMVGIDFISYDDKVYTITRTEFNLHENKLYFWTRGDN
jgi:hypothetical protein